MSVPRSIARVRRRLGALAWRSALGPVGGSVPRRYVRSIAEQAGTPSTATHIDSIELLAAAHVERYDFDPALPVEFRRSKAFDDRHVYRLRDVCASPRTGLCWLPRGAILEESYGSLIRLLGWGASVLDEPLVGARRTIEGPVVLLPGDGYFHWLLEALPAALHALERAPDAALLLPSSAPRYLDEALDLLGIENVYRSDEPVRVEELVLAARDPFSGFISREDVEIIRRTLLPRVGHGSDEALYVSRRLDRRSAANEPEVERALARLGFRIVTAQSLSFSEQIELFAGARVVAGAHGAGLANMVWSDAACLGEVFAARHFNDCYARLAVALGGTYRPFYCSDVPVPWGTAPVEQIAGTLRAAVLEIARVGCGRR